MDRSISSPTPQPPRARTRARRSRYRYTNRLGRSVPAALAVVFILGVLFGASVAVVRTVNFLHHVVNLDNPVKLVQDAVEPPVGSVAWKLKHGQQVNLLVLGYGGAENDAPYLSDSIMVITLDPASNRVVEASIPRDLYVRIDAWSDGRVYREKINTAFEVGVDGSQFAPGKKPEYTGADGGGHLSEHVVGTVTGIQFDKYVAVDFKAFRDVVDALGGVRIHMDSPLDDCHYPNYHNGYVNHGVPPGEPCPPGAGIHFKAGDYQVNGEQALEIARSRDASEPDQATDFARARRQQMIVGAIRSKAVSAGALTKAPQLMDALQSNFKTDLDLNDLKAIYDWAGKLPESSFVRVALTDQDLLDAYYQRAGGCGAPANEYVLCAEDRSFGYVHQYFANLLLPPPVLSEKAPVQIVNGTRFSVDLDERVTNSLRPLGLQLEPTLQVNHVPVERTVIYDYSGGKYPQTAAWLARYFDATVVPATAPSQGVAPSPALLPGEKGDGLVVVLGRQFGLRFYGLG